MARVNIEYTSYDVPVGSDNEITITSTALTGAGRRVVPAAGDQLKAVVFALDGPVYMTYGLNPADASSTNGVRIEAGKSTSLNVFPGGLFSFVTASVDTSISSGGSSSSATAANQATEIAALGQLHTDLGPVATAANQATEIAALGQLHTDLGPVATAANQATEIAALGQIHTDLTTTVATAANQATQTTALGQIHTDLTTTVATAANQATQTTALNQLHTDMGTVATAANQATQTTALNQLHTDMISAATPAGEAHIGEVGGNSAVVTASFSRPANTTAYALGQSVSNNTVVGSVAPMVLAASRVANKTGLLRRARLTKSNSTTTNAIFRAHFYSAAPTPTNGDGGTFQTADASIYLGSIDFDMTGSSGRNFVNGAQCISTPNIGSEIIFTPAAGTVNIYSLIEARAAYTPVSGETFTLALEVMRD